MGALTSDTLLGGRYRLARRIAVGGMGEVWRAEDTVLSRTVAVKVLKTEFTSDPTFLERFRTEARTTASLSHPGIAGVFDYGEAHDTGAEDSPLAYLVMEHVDGEPLSAQLARDGRLPAARVLDVVRQAALALSEAHRIGMVHRDVKPGNLLVRRSDGSIKITDFGIARAADAVPLTQNGMVVGTAQYFSPEQAEGRLVGPASDVYSLGVVAYECLAGRLPFLADSPVAVAMMQIRDAPPPLPPDVPGPVRALVLRTLAKDPRARFASGGELAETVRAVQEGRWDGASPLPRQPDGIGGTNPGMPAPPPWATPQQGPAAPPTAAPTPTPSPLPGSAGPSGSSWANPTPAGLLPGGPPTGTHAAPAYGGATAAPGAFGGSAGAGGFGGPEFGPPGATAAGPGGPAGPDSSGPQAFAPPAPGIGRRWRPAPGPPAGYGRRHGPRWPLWVAATVLLALAAAAVVTVLLTERDGSGGSGPDSGTREFAAIAGSHAPIESTDYGRLRAR